MSVEIKMPQLGQTSDEVRLVRWLVKEGDSVMRGQPLAEVETDKVIMELESAASGKVIKLFASADDIVSTGMVIAEIEGGQEDDKPFEKGKVKIEKNGGDGSFEGKRYRTAVNSNVEVLSLDHSQRQEVLGQLGKQRSIEMLETMMKIRSFEERIRMLFLEGKMPGTIHQYIGMEACATGVCAALKSEDVIASTHRPHGHAIAKGLEMRSIMAELYGKTTGCCKGKGGSMHVGDITKGILPAIAIVGGNIPIIGGMALAFKLRGEKRVAVSFFGDGASNEGAFHEGLNMAAIYDIPALFVCENNIYGASTNIKDTTRIENIADRVCSYGIRGAITDGMDVLSVYYAAKRLAGLAREGKGPSLLELKTFRFCGHSRRDPCNYMTKEEREYWQKRDPIELFGKMLADENIIDGGKIEELKADVEKQVDEAVRFGQSGPDPEPEDTFNDLYVNMEVPR